MLHDGHPVGSAALAGDTLPVDLTRLADLRVRPRALAHLLLSVPEEVLRRAGAIVVEMADEAGGDGEPGPSRSTGARPPGEGGGATLRLRSEQAGSHPAGTGVGSPEVTP